MKAEEQVEEQVALFELDSRARAKVQTVDVSQIDVPDDTSFDPHDVVELADSIRRVGLIHMPIVHRVKGRFVPIVGRRRCAALKLLAGLDAAFQHVPMFVRQDKVTDVDIAKLVLTENARRTANEIAELQSIQTLLKDKRLSIEGVANSIGQNVAWVKKRLLLAELPAKFYSQMVKGHVSFNTAVAVAKLDKPQREAVWQVFVEKRRENPDAMIPAADVSQATSLDVATLPPRLFAPLPATIGQESNGHGPAEAYAGWPGLTDQLQAVHGVLLDAVKTLGEWGPSKRNTDAAAKLQKAADLVHRTFAELKE